MRKIKESFTCGIFSLCVPCDHNITHEIIFSRQWEKIQSWKLSVVGFCVAGKVQQVTNPAHEILNSICTTNGQKNQVHQSHSLTTFSNTFGVKFATFVPISLTAFVEGFLHAFLTLFRFHQHLSFYGLTKDDLQLLNWYIHRHP